MLISSTRLAHIRSITEIAANLTLIAAVAVGITVWLRSPNRVGLVHDTHITPAANQNPAPGTKIDLPGVDWSAHKATLVVAISSACHFCVNSTPFYSQITHANHAAPVVVVMPQDKHEAQTFLRGHAITPSTVVSADLANIQVAATPTIMLISSSGTVTKSWVGELTEAQQKQVIESLDHV
jgi:hypothetical protein